MDSLLARAHSHLFITAKMRSDLFHHIMVLIYNNGISCQMDVRMNISLTYSTLVVYYVIKALPGLIVAWIFGGR